jgi:phosphoglycolate phosphatase
MTICFDLDGTLTDSAPGIVGCINHALERMERRRHDDEKLRAMIGLPLVRIFEALLESEDATHTDRAIAHFRERFDVRGIYENALFPGVIDGLCQLGAAGHELRIVTSKPADAARRVLEHFAIAHHFTRVHGPANDDRASTKRLVLGRALGEIGGERPAVVMVGDRVEDIDAGHAHGIVTAAVAWGYGTRADLTAAKPHFVAESMPELVAWLQTRGALTRTS